MMGDEPTSPRYQPPPQNPDIKGLRKTLGDEPTVMTGVAGLDDVKRGSILSEIDDSERMDTMVFRAVLTTLGRTGSVFMYGQTHEGQISAPAAPIEAGNIMFFSFFSRPTIFTCASHFCTAPKSKLWRSFVFEISILKVFSTLETMQRIFKSHNFRICNFLL